MTGRTVGWHMSVTLADATLLLGYLRLRGGAHRPRRLECVAPVADERPLARIIAENYNSVVAAQDMKESLERQDSAGLFAAPGPAGSAPFPAA